MLAQHHSLSMIKGKRSKRPRSASPLALPITTSSADLSSGTVGDGVISDVSPSNSSEFAHSATTDEEEADMANCLILLAKGKSSLSSPPAVMAAEAYQCKTCSKSFSSFQALGGHRASHKRPSKPTSLEEKKPNLMREKQLQESFQGDESTYLSLQISNRSPSTASPQSKTRVHECSICGAEFGSGQALGGHMRRHRPITVATAGAVKTARNLLSLDLNLPASEDDHDQNESKFPFATKDQVIVFAASPLIDCHY